MTSRKKTPASHELVSPETTDKPTRKYEADLGIVGVLKAMREKDSKSLAIQRETQALTALGSKLVDEQQVKENRVKGKADSYKPIKDLVAKVHAVHKSHTGKNPSLKVLVKKLNEQYPEGPIKKDGLPKAWTEGGIKDWWSALNKGKTILDGS